MTNLFDVWPEDLVITASNNTKNVKPVSNTEPGFSFSIEATTSPEQTDGLAAVVEMDENGCLVNVVDLPDEQEPGLENYGLTADSTPTVKGCMDVMFMPKIVPQTFGFSYVSDTEIIVSLNDECHHEFEFLIHALYQAEEEDTINILLGYNNLNEHESILLSDAIECSKATIKLIVSYVKCYADLRSCMYADSVACRHKLTIGPPSSFNMGTLLNSKVTSDSLDKYYREVLTELKDGGIVTEDELGLLMTSAPLITIPEDRIVK